jgi:hypothetical protein
MVHKFSDRADEQRKEAEVVRLRTPHCLTHCFGVVSPCLYFVEEGVNYRFRKSKRCLLALGGIPPTRVRQNNIHLIDHPIGVGVDGCAHPSTLKRSAMPPQQRWAQSTMLREMVLTTAYIFARTSNVARASARLTCAPTSLYGRNVTFAIGKNVEVSFRKLVHGWS